MFRFTIRGVLWLTLVVALGVGWWVDRNNVESLGKSRANAIQQAVIDAHLELRDWRFRAEALQEVIEQEEGKVRFRKDELGREEVFVVLPSRKYVTNNGIDRHRRDDGRPHVNQAAQR